MPSTPSASPTDGDSASNRDDRSRGDPRPTGATNARESDRIAPGAPDGGAPRSAVVADDDADLREIVQLWLTADRQWEVREAADGVEALAHLDGSVDLLVLDREMPGYTGPEVVDRLADTEFGGQVLVLSGRAPDERLSERDVTSYLVKPVDRETFVSQVEGLFPRG